MKSNRAWKLCFAAALAMGSAMAVTPAIGVASALGTFSVNDVKVEGNANIFEGSRLRTTGASSHIYLQSGSELTLGIDSAATFYKDHVLLQSGATKVDGMNHFAIHTAGYRIQSAEPASEAVVRLADGEVQIAAMTGAVNVFNSRGVMLSRISAGTASAFDSRSGDASGANPAPQSGAVAGQPPAQSGATAANPEEERRRRHYKEKLFTTLGVALGGLGLAVDAILQPGSTSP